MESELNVIRYLCEEQRIHIDLVPSTVFRHAHTRENGIEVSAMYSARKALAKKGALPKPKPPRFQKANIADSPTGTQWRVQLPNGAVVGFGGDLEAQVPGQGFAHGGCSVIMRPSNDLPAV